MHALGPAVAQFLLHGATGEVQPALIEKRTGLVRAGDPDHYRRSVSHTSEALFAFVQDGFGALLTLRYIFDSQQRSAAAHPVDAR